MALVKCPECANQVSEAAVACPKCGAPLATPHRGIPTLLAAPVRPKKGKALWLWLIPVGAVLLPIAVLMLFANSPPQSEPGIGVSYSQVMQNLDADFKMEPSTPVHGRTRYLAINKTSMLEIIGDKQDVTEVSLMIGMVKDDMDSRVRGAANALNLLKNIAPEWEGRGEWFGNAIPQAVSSDGGQISTVQGNKVITMQFFKPLAMLAITVKRSAT